MSDFAEDIVTEIRRNRAGFWMLQCQVSALENLVEKLAAQAGISEIDGVPLKTALQQEARVLSEKKLLEIENANPGGAAQIQQDLDQMEWPPADE
jgi:hypothetical protein